MLVNHTLGIKYFFTNYTTGIKFRHGEENTVYDDFGDTAMAGIEKFIADDEATPHLRPFWEMLKKEDADHDEE